MTLSLNASRQERHCIAMLLSPAIRRGANLFSAFFIFVTSVYAPVSLGAQNSHTGHDGRISSHGNQRRALVLDIDTRVLEDEQVVVWNETHRRLAIPGSPVGVKLVGSNVVVIVQFTPFIRRQNQNVLIAHGQIWIDDPEKGISYYTSIQTIPMAFGEPIFFFPLGQAQQLGSLIEIMITVNLYSENLIDGLGTSAQQEHRTRTINE